MSLRVCIIPSEMKGYRFFVGLDKRLSQVGITLQVVYGTYWPECHERKIASWIGFRRVG